MIGVEHHESYGYGARTADGSHPIQIALCDYGDGFSTITSFRSSDKDEHGRLHEIKLALMKLPRFEWRAK
jgi:hypothetical protein